MFRSAIGSCPKMALIDEPTPPAKTITSGGNKSQSCPPGARSSETLLGVWKILAAAMPTINVVIRAKRPMTARSPTDSLAVTEPLLLLMAED